MNEARHGKGDNWQKERTRDVSRICEARVYERDMRADMFFKTKFQLLGRCPLEPGEAVSVVKYQELGQELALSGEPSAGCPWHESGRRVDLCRNLQVSVKQLEDIYLLVS